MTSAIIDLKPQNHRDIAPLSKNWIKQQPYDWVILVICSSFILLRLFLTVSATNSKTMPNLTVNSTGRKLNERIQLIND